MTAAPLRIRAPEEGSTVTGEGDQYLSRLVKLVPSEVVVLYLTFKETATTWLGIWSTICLGLVVLTRTLGTHEAVELPASPPGLISVAISVWTFLIPLFYKGD
jgi:hypothetical protein